MGSYLYGFCFYLLGMSGFRDDILQLQIILTKMTILETRYVVPKQCKAQFMCLCCLAMAFLSFLIAIVKEKLHGQK